MHVSRGSRSFAGIPRGSSRVCRRIWRVSRSRRSGVYRRSSTRQSGNHFRHSWDSFRESPDADRRHASEGFVEFTSWRCIWTDVSQANLCDVPELRASHSLILRSSIVRQAVWAAACAHDSTKHVYGVGQVDSRCPGDDTCQPRDPPLAPGVSALNRQSNTSLMTRKSQGLPLRGDPQQGPFRVKGIAPSGRSWFIAGTSVWTTAVQSTSQQANVRIHRWAECLGDRGPVHHAADRSLSGPVSHPKNADSPPTLKKWGSQDIASTLWNDQIGFPSRPPLLLSDVNAMWSQIERTGQIRWLVWCPRACGDVVRGLSEVLLLNSWLSKYFWEC